MKLQKNIIALITVVGVVLTLSLGCQRNKFPTGAAKSDPNAPGYSIQAELNGGTAPVAPATK